MQKEDAENVQKEETEKPRGLASSLERTVPKLCTSINIALLGNKRNVVFTLLYGENSDSPALIDRVVIDISHVASLRDTLTQVLEEAKYDGMENSE